MENFWPDPFSWGDFLQIALMLILLYFLLHLIVRVLHYANFLRRYQRSVKQLVQKTLLVFEPIAILILGSAFLLINPVFHGISLLVLIVGGYIHIRNYISGQLFRLSSTLSIGQQLTMEDHQGIITHIDRLGVQIKTDQGLQLVSYTHLINEKQLSISGAEIGGFYQLKIIPKPGVELKIPLSSFADQLADAPYLDWSYRTEVNPALYVSNEWNAKVLVKEEAHLYDLIKLIDEWGYSCQILQKQKN